MIIPQVPKKDLVSKTRWIVLEKHLMSPSGTRVGKERRERTGKREERGEREGRGKERRGEEKGREGGGEKARGEKKGEESGIGLGEVAVSRDVT